MATSSIGSLSIDLLARTAGFTEGLDRAQRTAERSSRQIGRSLSSNIKRGSDDATASLERLATRVVGVVASFSALSGAARIADEFGQLTTQVRNATASAEEYQLVSSRLVEIANRTYRSFSEASQQYSQTAQSFRELGLSAREALDFTEAIGVGLVAGASSAQQGASAMNVFTQALNSGRLTTQNFNTLVSQTPRLVEALSAGLGATRQELQEMARAGRLTSDIVIPALTSQLEVLGREADALPTTIADAAIRFRNEFQQFIGSLNETSGATQVVVRAMSALADNLGTLTAVALAFVGVRMVAALTTWARGYAAASVSIYEAARAQASQASAATASATATTASATAANTAAVAYTRLQTVAISASRAAGTLVSAMGGWVGLAAIAASLAASFLFTSDASAKVTEEFTDLSRATDEVTRSFAGLTRAQQGRVLAGLADSIEEEVGRATRALSRLEPALNSSLSGLSGYRNIEAQEALAGFRLSLSALLGELRGGGITVDQYRARVDALRDTLYSVVDLTEAQKNAIDNATASFDDIARNVVSLTERQRELTSAVNEGSQADQQAAIERANANRALQESRAEIDKNIEAIQRQITAQRTQIITLREGAEAALRYQYGGNNNATEEQIAALEDLFAQYGRNARELEELQIRNRQNNRARIRDEKSDYDTLLESIRERTALLGTTTELERLNYRLTQGNLRDLTDAQKESLRTEQQIYEARNRANSLSNLREELELLQLTTIEREREVALRNSGFRGDSAERVEAYNTLVQLQQVKRVQSDVTSGLQVIQSEAAGLFTGMVKGTTTFRDGFVNALNRIGDRLLDMIAENLIGQLLFGAAGAAGANAQNNWLASLLSAVFSGYGASARGAGGQGGFRGIRTNSSAPQMTIPQRASGGYVEPYSLYRVNEYGMEGITVGGRDYLITGSHGGQVTNHASMINRSSGSQGGNLTVNVPVNVKMGDSENKPTNTQAANLGNELQRAITPVVMNILDRERRPGGMFWAMQQTGA